MKGIVVHWDSPWVDIYSGLDPEASALDNLVRAYGLELAVIAPYWPFPGRSGVQEYKALDDFLAEHAGESIALADYQDSDVPNADITEIDWLVLGPANGWQGAHADKKKWCYRPSPPGGFHALFLAHIAAHMSLEVPR